MSVNMLKDILKNLSVADVKEAFLNKDMVEIVRKDLPEIEVYYGNLILASDGEIYASICDFVKRHWRGKYRWFVKEYFDDEVLQKIEK
jgi:hypothetical protein